VLSGAMIKCKSETGFIPLEEKKMANLTPRQVMDRLKKQGLFLVKDGKYYYIPTSELAAFELPAEFQTKAEKISEVYFEPVNPHPDPADPPIDLNQKSAVFKGINHVLGQAFVVDGVKQAVILEDAKLVGSKFVSQTSESVQVIFTYSDDRERSKIKVDMTKGGRPSDE
jgi:hypothetical protein